MGAISRLLLVLAALAAACALRLPAAAQEPSGAAEPRVAILCYHRFGPALSDSMTVRTAVFASQLAWLRAEGFTVVPLRGVVDWLLGKGPAPPDKAVVITADDGHESVYRDMLPLVRKYQVPVTLFIYPSAISNAHYALTWGQLRELKATGLFDVQSHTYWHPNFEKEKTRLAPDAYSALVEMQFVKSKTKLAQETGGPVDLLAWPFGLFDEDLMTRAAQAGYVAAFTIERRRARKGDALLALPRFLMVDGDGVNGLKAIVTGTGTGQGPTRY